MSATPQVQVDLLGETVAGTIVAREPVADYGDGPRDELVVDVDGSRYRVDETALEE